MTAAVRSSQRAVISASPGTSCAWSVPSEATPIDVGLLDRHDTRCQQSVSVPSLRAGLAVSRANVRAFITPTGTPLMMSAVAWATGPADGAAGRGPADGRGLSQPDDAITQAAKASAREGRMAQRLAFNP